MTEPRFVEVAVDAPGVRGGQAFTYSVPAGLADIELGEAVMVDFGRRRAVGVVLGEGVEPPVEAAEPPAVDPVGAEPNPADTGG